MTHQFNLDFAYKGARQYIQGPDMFNGCMAALDGHFQGRIENIEFTVHSMTGANLVMTLFPKESAPKAGRPDIAIVKFSAGGQPWQGNLVEAATRPAERRPYDEAPVIEQCEIDEQDRSIVFTGREAPYSDIETLVSMNKALHQKLYPDVTGQWVFCGWKSPVWPLGGGFANMRIRIVKALGSRLTEAETGPDTMPDDTMPGAAVPGHLYFSARTEP